MSMLLVPPTNWCRAAGSDVRGLPLSCFSFCAWPSVIFVIFTGGHSAMPMPCENPASQCRHPVCGDPVRTSLGVSNPVEAMNLLLSSNQKRIIQYNNCKVCSLCIIHILYTRAWYFQYIELYHSFTLVLADAPYTAVHHAAEVINVLLTAACCGAWATILLDFSVYGRRITFQISYRVHGIISRAQAHKDSITFRGFDLFAPDLAVWLFLFVSLFHRLRMSACRTSI